MEIVYDESTGTWSEREEPYTTLDVQTEEDWNKLEFMINNFSRLEEENKELKRLLKLAVEDIKTLLCSVGAPIYSREGRESCKVCCFNHKCGCSNYCSVRTAYKKWKHAEEALEMISNEQS